MTNIKALMTVLALLASPTMLAAQVIPESLPKLLVHEAPKGLPPLPISGPDGEALFLNDLPERLTIVNYWATWCPPCREEMPALARLDQASGDDFDVITVSTDRGGREVAQAFYDEIGISNPPLFTDAKGKSARALGIRGLPATLIMNAKGEELARYYGPAEWDHEDVVAYLRALAGKS